MRVFGGGPELFRVAARGECVNQVEHFHAVRRADPADEVVYVLEFIIAGQTVQFGNEDDLQRNFPCRTDLRKFGKGGLRFFPAGLFRRVKAVVIFLVGLVRADVAQQAVELRREPDVALGMVGDPVAAGPGRRLGVVDIPTDEDHVGIQLKPFVLERRDFLRRVVIADARVDDLVMFPLWRRRIRVEGFFQQERIGLLRVNAPAERR